MGRCHGMGLQHADIQGVRRGGQASEWWNDEGLKALSARVVRAAPDDTEAHQMRAIVLSGQCVAWEVGPRSVAELREALTHLDRAAALEPAPAMKAEFAKLADRCRQLAASR